MLSRSAAHPLPRSLARSVVQVARPLLMSGGLALALAPAALSGCGGEEPTMARPEGPRDKAPAPAPAAAAPADREAAPEAAPGAAPGVDTDSGIDLAGGAPVGKRLGAKAPPPAASPPAEPAAKIVSKAPPGTPSPFGGDDPHLLYPQLIGTWVMDIAAMMKAAGIPAGSRQAKGAEAMARDAAMTITIAERGVTFAQKAGSEFTPVEQLEVVKTHAKLLELRVQGSVDDDQLLRLEPVGDGVRLSTGSQPEGLLLKRK